MSFILATNGYVEEGVFKVIPIAPPTKQKNLMKEVEQYIIGELAVHAAVDITYVKGGVGGDEVTTCATPAMTMFVYTDDLGTSFRKQSRDYLIQTTDLDFGGEIFKPESGDLILEQVGAILYTYEVGAFNNEPDWRYSGQYREHLRIHAKLIREETV